MPTFDFAPLLWWGLPLVAVPVAIHLINLLRHKRVPWAAMEFLVASQRKYRTRVLLRQLLLLALRTAAVAGFVLALAQPRWRQAIGGLLGGTAASHVVVLDGLRVTTPARVIMDLAAILPRSQVARVLDRAWGKRLLAIGDVASVLHDVRGKGRRGVRTVEALLAERVGHVSAETALELAFEDILLANSLPPMRRQVQLSDVEGWVGRVDYFDDDHGLVVFVDGDAWHRALTDTRSDAAQQHRLVAAGYRVARFSEGEIRFRQRSVASRMRDLRPARLAA